MQTRSVWWFWLLVLCLSEAGCRPKEPKCGDGTLAQSEECDDGNKANGDACNSVCMFPSFKKLALGANHTCALIENGAVRCWGLGASGQLGYGNTNNIGDDETPSKAGDVLVSSDLRVDSIAAGDNHTCALIENGTVRCWGLGASGQLGYGNTNNIGDDETPSKAGDINVGGVVTAIAAGANHTCALLRNGAVRCWGLGSSGQLGYGNTNNIGDDETPSKAGDVELGERVVRLAAGANHTCALLVTSKVRCWGLGASGQLGYGNTNNIGDDETPASMPGLQNRISLLATGKNHTCAASILPEGLRCWGLGASGQLGYGNTNNIGDDETLDEAGWVDFSRTDSSISNISAGGSHTCIILSLRRVRCWGLGASGQLGYGNTNNIGDNETVGGDETFGDDAPSAAAGDIQVASDLMNPSLIYTGANHTCIILSLRAVRCWGLGSSGQLGYGNTNNIGDDETPSKAGDVQIFSREATKR